MPTRQEHAAPIASRRALSSHGRCGCCQQTTSTGERSVLRGRLPGQRVGAASHSLDAHRDIIDAHRSLAASPPWCRSARCCCWLLLVGSRGLLARELGTACLLRCVTNCKPELQTATNQPARHRLLQLDARANCHSLCLQVLMGQAATIWVASWGAHLMKTLMTSRVPQVRTLIALHPILLFAPSCACSVDLC